MNTINNILNATQVNAALNEFESKVQLENLTLFDIIQATTDAPIILHKLTEDFIAIESHIDLVFSDLDKEYEAIVSESNKNILSIKNQHNQQILDKETELNTGTHISGILKEQIESLQGMKNIYNFALIFSIATGFVLISIIGVVVGVLVGGIGFVVFLKLSN